eukprot:1480972-Pyramimonas_sp.AAC.1
MALLERLQPHLEAQQSAGQAGFRKGFACDGHLLTLVQWQEKATEFRMDIVIAAVDFEKAFDS